MSTDESNAALRGSESNDLLGPLVDAAMASAKEVAYGTCATGANHLEGDYGTWDDWADLVERVAAQAVAAERERWRELLEARAAGCERAAENTEDPKFDAMARVLMSVREDGSKA